MPFYYTTSDLGQAFQIAVFTLDFTYNEEEFFCLVRAKTLESTVHYSLTLLNPEMEEILAEPYILTQKEQVLQIEAPIEKNIHDSVKFASIVALRNYLIQNNSAGDLRARYIA